MFASIAALVSLFVVLVALVAGALFLRRGVTAQRDGVPVGGGSTPKFEPQYVATAPLTPTEAEFFRRLLLALPGEVVAPQMAMSALVDIAAHQKSGKSAKQVHFSRSKFAQKRLDFVVLYRETFEVACVIELDDHTHDAARRKSADAERDALLEQLGYPVLRFDARKMPTAEQLRLQLDA